MDKPFDHFNYFLSSPLSAFFPNLYALYMKIRGPMHETCARGLALTAAAACLRPCSLSFIQKDVWKVVWLSGLISILCFYYYRLEAWCTKFEHGGGEWSLSQSGPLGGRQTAINSSNLHCSNMCAKVNLG
uniref:Uncharacterized protein n=1 Tax=Pipistrellus kuhlii TaxID=59472 RepID=A0A7J7YX63_PIPKU|nr:hypothetical protein mPipKuh1_009896 [Pipistrellus kuhlii]